MHLYRIMSKISIDGSPQRRSWSLEAHFVSNSLGMTFHVSSSAVITFRKPFGRPILRKYIPFSNKHRRYKIIHRLHNEYQYLLICYYKVKKKGANIYLDKPRWWQKRAFYLDTNIFFNILYRPSVYISLTFSPTAFTFYCISRTQFVSLDLILII